RIVIVDHIPLTSAGKIDRNGLADLLATRKRENGVSLPLVLKRPKKLDCFVKKAFESTFGRHDLKEETSLWDLGGTSLMAMTLDGMLQRETGVKVGMARLMRDG